MPVSRSNIPASGILVFGREPFSPGTVSEDEMLPFESAIGVFQRDLEVGSHQAPSTSVRTPRTPEVRIGVSFFTLAHPRKLQAGIMLTGSRVRGQRSLFAPHKSRVITAELRDPAKTLPRHPTCRPAVPICSIPDRLRLCWPRLSKP
jgi:hypothetical protein